MLSSLVGASRLPLGRVQYPIVEVGPSGATRRNWGPLTLAQAQALGTSVGTAAGDVAFATDKGLLHGKGRRVVCLHAQASPYVGAKRSIWVPETLQEIFHMETYTGVPDGWSSAFANKGANDGTVYGLRLQQLASGASAAVISRRLASGSAGGPPYPTGPGQITLGIRARMLTALFDGSRTGRYFFGFTNSTTSLGTDAVGLQQVSSHAEWGLLSRTSSTDTHTASGVTATLGSGTAEDQYIDAMLVFESDAAHLFIAGTKVGTRTTGLPAAGGMNLMSALLPDGSEAVAVDVQIDTIAQDWMP